LSTDWSGCWTKGSTKGRTKGSRVTFDFWLKSGACHDFNRQKTWTGMFLFGLGTKNPISNQLFHISGYLRFISRFYLVSWNISSLGYQKVHRYTKYVCTLTPNHLKFQIFQPPRPPCHKFPNSSIPPLKHDVICKRPLTSKIIKKFWGSFINDVKR